jgi:hypothetical protein
MCGKHGGGPRCQEDGCTNLARNKTGKCKRHTSKTKAKHRASDEASEPQVTDEVKQHAVNEAVGKLTGDAASRGLRPTGHITSISDDVKARIQKEIDLFEEEKKQRRGVCACCDELCKKVHEVHITEEWVERLKRRLPWMAEVPASLRDQYNVAKVDARLSSLASVPLSPRGVIRGDARCQSRLSFCASCYRSIRRSSQRKLQHKNCSKAHSPPPPSPPLLLFIVAPISAGSYFLVLSASCSLSGFLAQPPPPGG